MGFAPALQDGEPANANAGGREVGDYLRSRRRTDLFVALPRTSGTVQAQPERPSTEESLHYVNATGVSPVSIGLVQRLMSTAIGAAMFGGEGCDPIGSAVQVQVLVLCTLVLDPGWINMARGRHVQQRDETTRWRRAAKCVLCGVAVKFGTSKRDQGPNEQRDHSK